MKPVPSALGVIADRHREASRTSDVEVEQAAVVAPALDWYSNGLDFAHALPLASSTPAQTFATFDRVLRRRALAVGAPFRWRPEAAARG